MENILSANCGSCHGADAVGEASGGIRFIDDVDQLTAAGLILPLNSMLSPIVQVSARRTMPPPISGLPAMTEADLAVIISFIDNPRLWPMVPNTPGPAQDGGAAPPAADAGTGDG